MSLPASGCRPARSETHFRRQVLRLRPKTRGQRLGVHLGLPSVHVDDRTSTQPVVFNKERLGYRREDPAYTVFTQAW